MRILIIALLMIPGLAFAKESGRWLPCDDNKPQVVHIGLGRITVLSFPLIPKEVLPGENVFDFKQIKNDLAIKALRGSSRTNVVVYLQERRCAFDLIAVQGRGDDIISIRDPKDAKLEPRFSN